MKAQATLLWVIAGLAMGDTVGATVRDPMRPPGPDAPAAAPRAVSMPQLTAIMGTPGRRVAIVDGRVVRPGDRVGGVLIEAVTADGVRYRRGGASRELRLPAPVSIRRPTAAGAGGPEPQDIKQPARATPAASAEQ